MPFEPNEPSKPSTSTPLPVIPVSVLNQLARERLETAFPLCWVAGEVSNLSYASSGHVYFSLKDDRAQVRCALFRNRAQLLGWRLANGQHIEARVLVTLYEARGDFQLSVETARQAGVGNWYEQFIRCKEKLEQEGLFAATQKRALPKFPKTIGIITSLQAAALRDVLSTLKRRSPHVNIVLYPSPVQGEGAAAHLAEALRQAEQRAECEILILCRGGGSIEDLWAFNDESLARTIAACSIPIISGIGHETDFTIADFAADLRAPTPSAAAEQAAPESKALSTQLMQRQQALQRLVSQCLNQAAQQLDWLAARLQHPTQRLEQQQEQLRRLQQRLAAQLKQSHLNGQNALKRLKQSLLRIRPDYATAARTLDTAQQRLAQSWRRKHTQKSMQLTHLGSSLSHLNPLAVLARGYSITQDEQGQVVRNSADLSPGTAITLRFAHGQARAQILHSEDDTVHQKNVTKRKEINDAL
ncbi:MAG: exodeoxyribonuclease VII large subunit [Pseudomonadota bacterium]